MLTPEEIKQLPLPIIGLFNGLENEVVTNLADRLKFVGELNESERYRYKALNDYIDLENRFNNLKMDFDKQTQKEVDSLLEESARQCYLDDVGRYRLANKGLIHYYRNRRVQQFVDGIKLSTKGEFSNLARGMVLYDIDGKPHALNKVFSKTIDQAIFYSASGVYSYQEMAKRAIEVASKRGLCTIQGESGRVLRVDGYANLLLRTGLGRITNEITTLNLEQTGECYVEVSAHLGARPSHADWQGQIYYWQDKDTIGDNNSAGYPEFIASTGYGTGEGLGGYNCRHSFYPFFVGASKPSYTKSELDNFDKEIYTYKGRTYTTYDVTQKQRSFERAIRESKLKVLGYRNLGDNDASLYESVRLRRLQDEYKVFSQATNSRAKLERTGVVGYNRSVSKNITVDDFIALKTALKEAFGKDVKVKEEVVNAIYDSLNKFDGLKLYAGIKVKNLSKEIVFQTNTVQHGTWSRSEFIINRKAIEGMDIGEVDALFKDGKNTVCNSLEDGVYHEYMHALTADRKTFSHYERLCETKGIEGISDIASKDLAEMIAEIGVLKKQGKYDMVPEECKKIFEEEMGDLL